MQLDDHIRQALAEEADAFPTDAMTRLQRIDYRPRRYVIPPRVAGILAVGASAGAGTVRSAGASAGVARSALDAGARALVMVSTSLLRAFSKFPSASRD